MLIATAGFVNAQHDHHHEADDRKTSTDSMKMDTHLMSHLYSLNLPMNRNASGTAWLPDETPMYMYMTGKKAMWMFHGNIFLRYTHTDVFGSGSRGDGKFDAPNWFMAMTSKPVGKRGLLSARAMISLDPITEGGRGYPLLFQSGETYNGQPLVDWQHPHDLFSELSIGYSHAFSRDVDAFAYFGYPGEPALSAPAFMHRISAMNNPDAPLGHHWQDATHITFGVGTLGFRYKKWKLEGSIFTGREPDENRYDFDPARFDSYSYRVSFNPSSNWALQFSQGFIHSPESLHPDDDITRTTASVLYAKKFSMDRDLNMALIGGLNDKGDDHREYSALLEGNYRLGRHAIYGRYEWLQKSADELGLEDEFGHQLFDIQALTLGYNRSLLRSKVVELAAGAQATVNLPATTIRPIYSNAPISAQVYLQLRPVLYR